MSEKNILLKMTIEKNRLIHEAICRFLGHEPSLEEKKAFKITHRLGESNIYYHGKLISNVRYHYMDDPLL